MKLEDELFDSFIWDSEFVCVGTIGLDSVVVVAVVVVVFDGDDEGELLDDDADDADEVFTGVFMFCNDVKILFDYSLI